MNNIKCASNIFRSIDKYSYFQQYVEVRKVTIAMTCRVCIQLLRESTHTIDTLNNHFSYMRVTFFALLNGYQAMLVTIIDVTFY